MSVQKVALVTAGASGIGRAIARRLLSDGVAVHICDFNQEAIDECIGEMPTLTATCCDLSDSKEVEKLFQAFSALHKRLDILVNNVGIAGPTAKVDQIEVADWDKTIAVDLSASFYVTRLATPMLRESRGTIVNISSNAALFGFPLRSPYTAAKWALIGLTKTWAMELGPDGISVNAICPGSVKGDRIDGVIERDAAERGLEPKKIRDVYLRQSSLRIFVDAEDIAQTVKFLTSKAGRSISGQALAVDGHTEGLSNWLD